jgi:hypothetical protein
MHTCNDRCNSNNEPSTSTPGLAVWPPVRPSSPPTPKSRPSTACIPSPSPQSRARRRASNPTALRARTPAWVLPCGRAQHYYRCHNQRELSSLGPASLPTHHVSGGAAAWGDVEAKAGDRRAHGIQHMAASSGAGHGSRGLANGSGSERVCRTGRLARSKRDTTAAAHGPSPGCGARMNTLPNSSAPGPSIGVCGAGCRMSFNMGSWIVKRACAGVAPPAAAQPEIAKTSSGRPPWRVHAACVGMEMEGQVQVTEACPHLPEERPEETARISAVVLRSLVV